jgi:phosphomannomutase
LIASLSGIRGILNQDIVLPDVARFATNFAKAAGASEFLLARDTRKTGPAMCKAVAAGVMSVGGTVLDYGIISTPALFRESRVRNAPAVMVTASHNEPEFNGLKFIAGGSGIGKETFDRVLGKGGALGRQFTLGRLREGGRPCYVDDLAERYGEGSCEGVKVAVDLGGGAAISHAVPLLRRLGCQVSSLNDSYSVFTRTVDPVADDLALLRRTVKEKGCAIGLAFDCDGDRLVIVDSAGRKKSGDYMLTLALRRLVLETGERKVVVSVDTTQAVDDVARESGCSVFRSKVGEANVVQMMKEKGARLGGEGSSGGVIDGDFNNCRDSLLAALAIIKALRKEGDALYARVPAYHQNRIALRMPKRKVKKALRVMARMYEHPELTDGLKVVIPRRGWVLVRPSGTEDVVRVSAEATSAAKAENLTKSFAGMLKRLSK